MLFAHGTEPEQDDMTTKQKIARRKLSMLQLATEDGFHEVAQETEGLVAGIGQAKALCRHSTLCRQISARFGWRQRAGHGATKSIGASDPSFRLRMTVENLEVRE